MDRPPAPADTDRDVFLRQVECWRSMSCGERADLADRLSRDVTEFAKAGIRFDRPAASVEEVRFELARRRYGRRLAEAAYAHAPLHEQ